MKSFIKLLLLSGVMAGTVSCTDLDTDLNGQYTKVPHNDILTQSRFEACYYYLRQEAWFGRNFWEGVFLQGDEAIGCTYDGLYYDNGRHILPSQHNLNPDVPGTGMMGAAMEGISYTNIQIKEFGGADGKDPMVAPLRAIRALYHFWIMELYGDVPILDHQLEADEFADRMPRKQVAEWIESELLDILSQEGALKEENNSDTYGRPNKWMAEALLVKLYLNWGVYTNDINTVNNNTPNEKLDDCVYWCDQLTASGLFEVGKGYRKKFFPDNGVQIKDFIYAIPFDTKTLWVSDDWRRYSAGHEMDRWFNYRYNTCCKPSLWNYTVKNGAAGIWILTNECVARFNLPGDERNDMILNGQVYAFDAITFEKTDEPVVVYTNARFRTKLADLKFTTDFEFVDKSTNNLGSDNDYNNLMKGARLAKYPVTDFDDKNYGRIQSNDIPMFRYADILLTKAECILRGAKATNGDTPASLIDKVRDCSSAPHINGTPTLQDVLDERCRELIYEPWRRNDLIRFGQFEADWGIKNEVNPSAKETWRRLMPIPTSEMERNTNWKQNPNY